AILLSGEERFPYLFQAEASVLFQTVRHHYVPLGQKDRLEALPSTYFLPSFSSPLSAFTGSFSFLSRFTFCLSSSLSSRSGPSERLRFNLMTSFSTSNE